MKRSILFVFLLLLPVVNLIANTIEISTAISTVDLNITVMDSVDSSPMISATVNIKKDDVSGAMLYTNSAGQVHLSHVQPGKYYITVSFKEYSEFKDTIAIDSSRTNLKIYLSPNFTSSSKEVTVSAYKLIDFQKIQVNTGNQIFNTETYHSSPNLKISDIIQQNVNGAVKAPTGEIHIILTMYLYPWEFLED